MKTNANSGDLVEVHLSRKIYEGVLLESSEIGIVLLKLGSGYNIGFNKKDVLEIKVLKKAKEETPKGVHHQVGPEEGGARTSTRPRNISSEMFTGGKPNVGMIITGGTIAARLNPTKGGVDWLDTPESLFKFYPEIFEKVNISKVEVPFMKASEDMDYKDWQKIAKSCEKLLNDTNIRGVIVTHGTDFLHYTSAALSFFLKNLNKPVVLTYSQRSIDRASSDANLNLVCSAEVAGMSDIGQVVLVGHANSNDDFCYVMPGAKVKKMHSSKRDAFKVINDKPIAKVFPNRLEVLKNYKIGKKGNVKVDSKFEEKVALVKVYPGQSPDILDYYMKKKYKGIVLEVSGLGHVPTKRSRNSWTKKLKEVISKGMVVCACAQTVYGKLDPLVYSNGREILATGVIYLEDMLAETALVKLGWVLGHSDWKVEEKMLENISGELNDRLEE